MRRYVQHLLTTQWQLQRNFPRATLDAIEAAVRIAETQHSGEICFVIESRLGFARLRAGVDARRRAHEIFSLLGVWNTHENNGVLIYLLLAEHDIEIVADRGFDGNVSEAEWLEVCRVMESELGAGRFEAGALAGIERVSGLIARHFPPRADDRNELPDAPVIIR
jgi:uncharacterized membrane protein